MLASSLIQTTHISNLVTIRKVIKESVILLEKMLSNWTCGLYDQRIFFYIMKYKETAPWQLVSHGSNIKPK